MANSLNRVLLIGNLGKDPEVRSTNQENKEIVFLNLATSESWKNKSTGERKEKTEWHRVVIFKEGLVYIAKKYLKKGSKVYLEGQLQTRRWVDSSGTEKFITEVVLQNFSANLILLDKKVHAGGSHSESEDIEQSSAADILDDEIPF